MAMNGNTLGVAVASKVYDENAAQADKDRIESVWKKICTEIVNHIKNNIDISVTVNIPANTIIDTDVLLDRGAELDLTANAQPVPINVTVSVDGTVRS